MLFELTKALTARWEWFETQTEQDVRSSW